MTILHNRAREAIIGRGDPDYRGRVRVEITPMVPDQPTKLGDALLKIDAGRGFSFGDYPTADELDELADLFRAGAADAREVNDLPAREAPSDGATVYVCGTLMCSEHLRGYSTTPTFCSICMNDLTAVPSGESAA